eukprot:Nk52_evm3s210 gene=Nk52_evmTU3s210
MDGERYHDSCIGTEEDEEDGREEEEDTLPQPSNDELLYDPEADDEDEKWVADMRSLHNGGLQRGRYYNPKKEGEEEERASNPNSQMNASSYNHRDSGNEGQDGRNGHGVGTGPGMGSSGFSDAVLSCPCCMTTVCMECQRHEMYTTQYRAIFVRNCKIMKNEILRSNNSGNNHDGNLPASGRMGGPGRGSLRYLPPTAEEGEDIYRPVRCKECNTEIAVIDSDEVFHFFHVLASQA